MMDSEELHRIKRKAEIETILDRKQQEYQAARTSNQPELADKIEMEFFDLLTELRFVDPDAELTIIEEEFKKVADELNKRNVMKQFSKPKRTK